MKPLWNLSDFVLFWLIEFQGEALYSHKIIATFSGETAIPANVKCNEELEADENKLDKNYNKKENHIK